MIGEECVGKFSVAADGSAICWPAGCTTAIGIFPDGTVVCEDSLQPAAVTTASSVVRTEDVALPNTGIGLDLGLLAAVLIGVGVVMRRVAVRPPTARCTGM